MLYAVIHVICCHTCCMLSYMLYAVIHVICCHTCYMLSYMLYAVIHVICCNTCCMLSYMLYAVIHVVCCYTCYMLSYIRCHRIRMRARACPIIARFREYNDRELVWSRLKQIPKNTGFFISEDFPKSVTFSRKKLLPVFLPGS